MSCYVLMSKEALEDHLRLKTDGNNVSIDSVEMEVVNGEEMIKLNLSGNVPDGRARMVMRREIVPSTHMAVNTTEILSSPSTQ